MRRAHAELTLSAARTVTSCLQEAPRFHSARLVYRAFDKETDKDFVKELFSGKQL